MMIKYEERYAKLSDEELLTLAAQTSTLLESARSALQTELSRRRLKNISLGEYQAQAEKLVDTAIGSRGPVVRGKWVAVVVPRGSLQFPSVCPSCLGPNPDTLVSIRSEQESSKYRVLYRKVEYLVIAVPHCRACARRFNHWQSISSVFILLGIAAALAIAVYFDLNRWAIWFLGIAFAAPGILASIYVKRAVRFVGYDEKSVDFKFKSIQYANLFYQSNSPGRPSFQ